VRWRTDRRHHAGRLSDSRGRAAEHGGPIFTTYVVFPHSAGTGERQRFPILIVDASLSLVVPVGVLITMASADAFPRDDKWPAAP
jgi:hypothetical protein